MPTLQTRLANLLGNRFGRFIHIISRKVTPIMVTQIRKGSQTVSGYKPPYAIGNHFTDASESFSYVELFKDKKAFRTE